MGWELQPAEQVKSNRHKDTGIKPEAGVHKEGAVSPDLGKETLLQEELTSEDIPCKSLKLLPQSLGPFLLSLPHGHIHHPLLENRVKAEVAPQTALDWKHFWTDQPLWSSNFHGNEFSCLLREGEASLSLSKAPGWGHGPMCHLSIPGQSRINLYPSASSSLPPIPAMHIKTTKNWRWKSDIFFFSAQRNRIFLPTMRWKETERRASPWESGGNRAQDRGDTVSPRVHTRTLLWQPQQTTGFLAQTPAWFGERYPSSLCFQSSSLK